MSCMGLGEWSTKLTCCQISVFSGSVFISDYDLEMAKRFLLDGDPARNRAMTTDSPYIHLLSVGFVLCELHSL